MSRWVRCSYGKRAGFVVANDTNFLHKLQTFRSFFNDFEEKRTENAVFLLFYSRLKAIFG
jgi:hypothetical protein